MEKALEVTLVRGLVGSARQAGKLVGLVPTMGALHEGHMSLVRLARESCEFIVVSIFVNRLQFSPGEDFQRYPRRPEKDFALCEQAGVDLLYTPGARDFYPSDFSTAIEVADVSEGGEGAMRPGHFRGVATALTKIFLQVSPDLVVFGRKDLQRVAIVRRLIRDLDFPIQLVVGQTVRDADGLALSSRNTYLSPEDRKRAAAFPKALFAAKASALRGERDPSALERDARRMLEGAGFTVDYVEVVDSNTMHRPPRIEPGSALSAAIRLGKTCLIDNVLLLEQ